MYIFDIEGTLSNCDWRKNLLPDFDKFHYCFPCDSQIKINADLCKLLSKTDEIIILTGMSEKYRKNAEKWLAQNGIKYSSLIMREVGDLRPSPEFKFSKFINLPNANDLKMLFDDRLDIVGEFISRGFKAVKV